MRKITLPVTIEGLAKMFGESGEFPENSELRTQNSELRTEN